MTPTSISHETYGSRLWRRFASDSFAVTGLAIVALLFIVAALAPFLANSHAIVRCAAGTWSFPIFASMEAIEWRFLLYVPLAALVILLRHRLFQNPKLGVSLVVAFILLVEMVLAI